ncbi:amidohydrolase [Clostridiaceae bacterium JG1575]|nr:amidohydrolase [Clostridiaceae bacterium JG1575]
MKRLIDNATVYPMDQDPILGGWILLDEDRIAALGTKEQAPPEWEERLDAKGAWVLPGFIDGHTHLGMHEAALGFEGNDTNEASDPLTPQVRAIDGCNPRDVGFAKARSAGVTLVMAGPGSANVVGGTFMTIRTYGECIDDMVLPQSTAMKCAFGENPKRFYGKNGKMPITRMGTASLLRKTLQEAKNYQEKKARALEKGDYFEEQLGMEAMLKVLNQEMPLKAHAHRADDILTALRIAREFKVDITLDHCTEGHLIKESLKGQKAFVGPTFLPASKVELQNKGFETVVELMHSGVLCAITTDHPVISLELLPVCAGLAMKAGLTEQEALSSITINPAKILGIDSEYGTLTVGKKANLTLYDATPLSNLSQCLMTIADGQVVYAHEKAPKAEIRERSKARGVIL